MKEEDEKKAVGEQDAPEPQRKDESEDADERSEKESEESFPASDPPSW